MPTGAMKVALCFSFASINIVKTSSAVRIASMNIPCTILVPPASVVLTFNGVGKRTKTIADAAMEPRICAQKRQTARTTGMAPTRTMPRVTAGLKRPPEMRKKTQTFTIRENPKETACIRVSRNPLCFCSLSIWGLYNKLSAAVCTYNVQIYLDVKASGASRGTVVGCRISRICLRLDIRNLCPGECKEEKHCCANKFS